MERNKRKEGKEERRKERKERLERRRGTEEGTGRMRDGK